MNDSRIEAVSAYLGLSACAVRNGNFWFAGDWHRCARHAAAELEPDIRARAMVLLEALEFLALRAEYARSRVRLRKRGRCLACGEGPVLLFKVTGEWACADCAAEIEDGNEE